MKIHWFCLIDWTRAREIFVHHVLSMSARARIEDFLFSFFFDSEDVTVSIGFFLVPNPWVKLRRVIYLPSWFEMGISHSVGNFKSSALFYAQQFFALQKASGGIPNGARTATLST